jgi:hypothetical protein
MNNSLVVDILYPNRYSRWRNLEIKFFMDEFESDILIFRVKEFAGITFDCDYEFCNIDSNLKLENYNILVFDPQYNYLNKYNKNIDGTLFNNKFYGSYLITKNTDFILNDYSFVYHIFLMCYTNFNNNYTFDHKKQLIHLYPGGGFNGNIADLNKINKDVKIISSSPITTKLLEKTNNQEFIELKTGPMFYKNEKIKYKDINNGDLTICFSSLGNGDEKGDDKYLRIINDYKSKYPNDKVNFISIGNCKKHNNIINYGPMDYIELDNFYYNNVDVYLNLETGKSFNGWPLGMESLKSGSVLLTTDSLNNSIFYDLQSEPFYVINDLNNYVNIIKSLYDDRDKLQKKSKEGQKFVIKYSSYENQQIKVRKFIEEKIPL